MQDQPAMTGTTRARRAMVDSQLRPQGVVDPRVLAAMAEIPREDYLPASACALAYVDRSIAVEGGVIIPPAPLGRLLDAAAPQPGESALVVGAAPDYAVAILRAIGLDVVEQFPADAVTATAPAGPFDLVLIEGGVAELPACLVDALAPGGRLVTAMRSEGGVTRLSIGRKVGDRLGFRHFADSEIPLLPQFVRPPAFTF